jgi:hypothetical protein
MDEQIEDPGGPVSPAAGQKYETKSSSRRPLSEAEQVTKKKS